MKKKNRKKTQDVSCKRKYKRQKKTRNKKSQFGGRPKSKIHPHPGLGPTQPNAPRTSQIQKSIPLPLNDLATDSFTVPAVPDVPVPVTPVPTDPSPLYSDPAPDAGRWNGSPANGERGW